jgi:hypothetical protein
VKTLRLIEQEREQHAVSLLCAVLRVTRQGYYAWRRREATPGPRRQADAVYCGAIMRLYRKSRETYGAPGSEVVCGHHLETREGYLFLAVVSDAFSRRIVERTSCSSSGKPAASSTSRVCGRR